MYACVVLPPLLLRRQASVKFHQVGLPEQLFSHMTHGVQPILRLLEGQAAVFQHPGERCGRAPAVSPLADAGRS